ncbi:epidermal growth factor receptor-like [Penaeus monodon]|uniref:epidermal growth factor receptor-like n=1 Tax=Penaeus monodon TaxID=6687 RepID=UPI0018A7A619|nr:epidermal growth factor receptor-like [Penaeus monodon]
MGAFPPEARAVVGALLVAALCHASASSLSSGTSPLVVVTPTDADSVSVCQGTSHGLSASPGENTYLDLKQRYSNCTLVDGNLELTWLQGRDLDLSFLQDIREVTGYVLLDHVTAHNVRLPFLTLIRGTSLLPPPTQNAQRPRFGLLVAHAHVDRLEMPALGEILEGSVGVFNSTGLCHWRSVDWSGILSYEEECLINPNSLESSSNCTCDIGCSSGCWGEREDSCHSLETCSQQCHGFPCYGTRPEECCHPLCAAGCTGPSSKDCRACRFFSDGGECVPECLSVFQYNVTTSSWDTDPHGKYSFVNICVEDCPAPLLKEGGMCVRKCSQGKTGHEGMCVPCEGPCPEVCPGVGVVHAGNVKFFKGCTTIRGSLILLNESFSGHEGTASHPTSTEGYAIMNPKELEVFSTVKEVTGYIDIRAAHPLLTNLSFLRNLEVVGGESLTEYSSSIFITGTSLQNLALSSLRIVKAGHIRITDNSNLCYVENVRWEKIIEDSGERVHLMNNADRGSCTAASSVCHETCSDDGCWGSGQDQCLSCKNFSLQNTCVEHCNISRVFQVNSNICDFCHEECEERCYGLDSDQCERCKNVEKGSNCVPECSDDEFEDNGVCLPCDISCIYGCSGPSNIVGKGGCTKCAKYVMNGNLEVTHCLPHGFHCPEGNFFDWLVIEDSGNVSLGSRCYLHCDLKFPQDNSVQFDCSHPCPEEFQAFQAVPVCLVDKRRAHRNLVNKVNRQLNRAEQFRYYNAYITTDRQYAQSLATDLDALGDTGDMVLYGMTIAMKDNIDVANMPHTAGHMMLSNYVPKQDAPLSSSLKNAGVIILGKVNMHELAYGVTSNNAAFGPVRNAFNSNKFAGGSSGGTATAVALGLADAGIGSDTGGSSRIPAAVSGIVGFRPSTGRYPAEGMTHLSWTRDTPGPMARDVRTVAVLDAVLAGSSSSEIAPIIPRDIRLGVPRTHFYQSLSRDVSGRMEEVLKVLSAEGIELVEANMHYVPKLTELTGFPVIFYESLVAFHQLLNRTNLRVSFSDFVDGISSPDVKNLVKSIISDPVPELKYQQSLYHYRLLLKEAYQEYFDLNRVDAAIFPSVPLPAMDIVGSEDTVMLHGDQVPTLATYIRNTDPSSNAGVPSLAIPMGVNREGLPMGLQIEGPEGSDRKLLAIGAAVEEILSKIQGF